jgi:hypothetical protein
MGWHFHETILTFWERCVGCSCHTLQQPVLGSVDGRLKVDEPDGALGIEDHVVELDVAVADPPAVQRLHRPQQLIGAGAWLASHDAAARAHNTMTPLNSHLLHVPYDCSVI